MALQAVEPAWSTGEIVAAACGISTGVATLILAARLTRAMPWPRPFRLRFVATHLAAALSGVALWVLSSRALVMLVTDGSFLVQRDHYWMESLFIGFVAYTIVTGVSYAVEGNARAARTEAVAARTQLAALRAQLHPHFLFNALHSVVQLIPVEPRRAADAAELVADLLRTTLEEKRDEVTLGDEWSFVSRYLALERIRFGDRLVVREDLPASLLDEPVPAFALQTLVENAVLHGAAPRVAPTEIAIRAEGDAAELTLTVRNGGDRGAARLTTAGAGTGLARLRERLTVLYGSAARLECGPLRDGGFEAVLVVPRRGEA